MILQYSEILFNVRYETRLAMQTYNNTILAPLTQKKKTILARDLYSKC